MRNREKYLLVKTIQNWLKVKLSQIIILNNIKSAKKYNTLVLHLSFYVNLKGSCGKKKQILPLAKPFEHIYQLMVSRSL